MEEKMSNPKHRKENTNRNILIAVAAILLVIIIILLLQSGNLSIPALLMTVLQWKADGAKQTLTALSVV